jgi:glucan-binding YG repeat protein
MLASVALLVVSAASIVSARGWVQQGGNWYYQNADGDFVTETMQNSNNSKFYLGEDGAMVTDYFLEDYGDGANCYYFGSNGAMVTNTWVAIDPAIVSNQADYVPTVYWYYFGATGKATKASDNASGGVKKVTIDGKKYAFNTYGQMLTGWIDSTGATVSDEEDDPFATAVYYAGGDNDGVLRSGWLTYYDGASATIRDGAFDDRAVLYFYFKPSNNVKMGIDRENGAPDVDNKTEYGQKGAYKTKKINGRTYAFDAQTGVMLAEWDGFYNGSATKSYNTKYYFSAEDDGHQVKKGWIYAVPDETINSEDYYDDEERYMYFTNSGDIVEDQIKKINGKYYGFDGSGVMKTGLVVYYKNGKYAGKFNGDNTKGEELAKMSTYRNGDNEERTFTKDAKNGFIWFGSPTPSEAKIHYFGSDGARRTGANVIEFADDSYTFSSDNNGHYEGTKKKKYYSNGILLKASTDLRYGIITLGAPNTCKSYDWEATDYSKRFCVLNTGGSIVKGSTSSKKDADGNFWLIAKDSIPTVGEGTINAGDLIGIWSVDVRIHGLNTNKDATNGSGAVRGLQFKADSFVNSEGKEQNNRWLNADNSIYSKAAGYPIQDDSTGRHVTLSKRGFGTDGSYAVDPNNDAALNFTWVED